jgi:hypothetical protein
MISTSRSVVRLLAFLMFLAAAAGVSLSARADLRLRQIASAGFALGDITAVVPLGDEGAQRIALLARKCVAGLQWSPSRGAYVSSFFIQLPFDPGAMILSDIDGDGRNEIVVFERSGKRVFAYDPSAGAFLRSIDLPEAIDRSAPIEHGTSMDCPVTRSSPRIRTAQEWSRSRETSASGRCP